MMRQEVPMRSNVVGKWPWLTALIILLAVGSALLAQQQSVQCADPPGGTITCEKGQLATCTVTKGKVEGRCQTPPSNLTEKLEVDAWILSAVTKSPVASAQVNKSAFQEILKNRRWEKDDKIVTFNYNSVFDPTRKPY